jgi:hypothetical protein
MLCPYGDDLGGADRLGRAFGSQKSRRDAGATKDGPTPLVETGLLHSGHSPATTCGTQRARMLPRPYENDLARADKVGACVRGVKRAGETPALRKTGRRHWLRLGCGTAGAACCAPTGCWYGNTSPSWPRRGSQRSGRGGWLGARWKKSEEPAGRRGYENQRGVARI